MAKNYIEKGDTLVITSADAVAVGDLVKVEESFGVAQNAATASGQPVILAMAGVFELPAATAEFKVGQVVYDAGDGSVKATKASSELAVGIAWTGKASSSTAKIQVKLG